MGPCGETVMIGHDEYDDDGRPLPNGQNGPEDGHSGRDPVSGQFVAGNRYGTRGSPYAHKVAAWRKAFAEGVTEADVRAAVERLVESARAGERWAIVELLNRTAGSLVEAELEERIRILEESL